MSLDLAKRAIGDLTEQFFAAFVINKGKEVDFSEGHRGSGLKSLQSGSALDGWHFSATAWDGARQDLPISPVGS